MANDISKNMFVFKTEKGYLKGDILAGIKFVKNKKDARKFTLEETALYASSISADLNDFFNIHNIEIEIL